MQIATDKITRLAVIDISFSSRASYYMSYVDVCSSRPYVRLRRGASFQLATSACLRTFSLSGSHTPRCRPEGRHGRPERRLHVGLSVVRRTAPHVNRQMP